MKNSILFVSFNQRMNFKMRKKFVKFSLEDTIVRCILFVFRQMSFKQNFKPSNVDRLTGVDVPEFVG